MYSPTAIGVSSCLWHYGATCATVIPSAFGYYSLQTCVDGEILCLMNTILIYVLESDDVYVEDLVISDANYLLRCSCSGDFISLNNIVSTEMLEF